MKHKGLAEQLLVLDMPLLRPHITLLRMLRCRNRQLY